MRSSDDVSMSGLQIEEALFQPGDILFEEGETTLHFYIIQDGEVEVFKKSSADGELHLAKLSSGACLGEFAMIDHQPRSASARALTPVKAARVSPEAYEELLNELPDWIISVMRSLIERIRHTNEIVRALQAGLNKSETGSGISLKLENAVNAAEYSDTTRRARIAAAEADETVTDFDFSVYDTHSQSGMKPSGKTGVAVHKRYEHPGKKS